MKNLLMISAMCVGFAGSAFAENNLDAYDICFQMGDAAVIAVDARKNGVDKDVLFTSIQGASEDTRSMLATIINGAYDLPFKDTPTAQADLETGFRNVVMAICLNKFIR